MALDYLTGDLDPGDYLHNGGAWFMELSPPHQKRIAAQLAVLPVALEVETPSGLVGIVHGDCPFASWDELVAGLCSEDARAIAETCLSSRERISAMDDSGVMFRCAGYLTFDVGKEAFVISILRQYLGQHAAGIDQCITWSLHAYSVHHPPAQHAACGCKGVAFGRARKHAQRIDRYMNQHEQERCLRKVACRPVHALGKEAERKDGSAAGACIMWAR